MTHVDYVRFASAAVALTLLDRPGAVPRPELLPAMFEIDFVLLSLPLLALDWLPDDQGLAKAHARLAPVLDGRTPTEVRRHAREFVAGLRPAIEAKLAEIERRQQEQSTMDKASAREQATLQKARGTLDWLATTF